MKLITRKTKAKVAASEFQEQYKIDENRKRVDSLLGTFKRTVKARIIIYDELIKLGDNPSPDDVDQIIGNDTWTEPPSCDECGNDGHPVVMLGQEPDDESNTAWICESCLRRAIALLDSQK